MARGPAQKLDDLLNGHGQLHLDPGHRKPEAHELDVRRLARGQLLERSRRLGELSPLDQFCYALEALALD